MSKRQKLYTHQEEGVTRILQGFCSATYATKDGSHRPMRSLLLHDDMGLGKTRQALEALSRMMGTERFMQIPTLIVVPASCIHIWQEEMTEHFSDTFTDIRQFINEKATIQTLQNLSMRTVIITSYSTLQTAFQTFLYANLPLGSIQNSELIRLCQIQGSTPPVSEDRAELLKLVRQSWNDQAKRGINTKDSRKTSGYAQLLKLPYNCVILDEVHSIKNVTSKSCKAVAFVNATFRLGLSGTPTMNHGGEMLTILKYGLCLFEADWNQIYRDPDGE